MADEVSRHNFPHTHSHMTQFQNDRKPLTLFFHFHPQLPHHHQYIAFCQRSQAALERVRVATSPSLSPIHHFFQRDGFSFPYPFLQFVLSLSWHQKVAEQALAHCGFLLSSYFSRLRMLTAATSTIGRLFFDFGLNPERNFTSATVFLLFRHARCSRWSHAQHLQPFAK